MWTILSIHYSHVTEIHFSCEINLAEICFGAYAESNDTDQHVHLHSLIMAFNVQYSQLQNLCIDQFKAMDTKRPWWVSI